jgi:hypothetical protein
VCLLVGHGGLHWAASRGYFFRDPLYADKASKLGCRLAQKTLAGQQPFVVLMLGSSRTGAGLHAEKVEAALAAELRRPVVVFNFGIPAAGPITLSLYYRRLRAEGVRPDVVLVEVLPSMLAVNDPGIVLRPAGAPLEQAWLPAARFQRREIPLLVRYGWPAEATRKAWWEENLSPWYGLRHAMLARVVPEWVPWSLRSDWSRGTDETGSSSFRKGAVSPADYARGVAHARLEYAALLATYEPGGPAGLALQELLALIRTDGAQAGVVLMPEGAEFRSWYGPTADQNLTRYLTDLCGPATPLFDARNWVPADGFADAHHLLGSGADVFSRRFGPALVPLVKLAVGPH